ncbi:MAG: hypothetical protein LBS45_04110 [Synergistaceae bacterium]|jgi:hypothetical protein|nr:hypothetical protein [Synergistaceae bacterium]
MALELKLFTQGRFFMPGCCGVTTLRFTDGEELFSNPAEYKDEINGLLTAVKERYGNRLDVSVVNSWGFFALWDVIRFAITPSKPAWIMRGKKIVVGVPDKDELFAAIDAELTAVIRA